MREFAEAEIVIPSGPFEGRRFSTDRQPFSRLWFEEVDSGRWRRVNTTGPSQSGKTLLGFVTPTMYHLFEVGETVIVGLPSMDMAADKWTEDLLPAIAASRYRELLPKSGAGSKGGVSNLTRVQFGNGQTLRFMTGGGDDKSRAGFTSRVVCITETDGMDEPGTASREADKIKQLEARTRSFGDRARIYLECTVSLESGRTWFEHKAGTESRLILRCPHCNGYVTPERQHLMGWQDAADELEAKERASLVCPSCGQLWTEQDRRTANHAAKLIHRGQEIGQDGIVAGDPPRTNTLSFRWTAANNLLVPIGVIGADEWRASRSANEENAEKEMRQFVWAMPHKPATVDLTSLDAHAITKRTRSEPRGYCPTGTRKVLVGIDVGKWLCHWMAIAFLEHATPHIIDYGRIEVPSDTMAEETAILTALRGFRDTVLKDGWESEDGRRHHELAVVDAGNWDETIYAFCQESGSMFIPSKGYGSTQRSRDKFRKRSRNECVAIGDGYQVVMLVAKNTRLLEIDSDHWKGWFHARLQTPLAQPGALTLFKAHAEVDHLTIAKHFTAERKVEEFKAGSGLITRWEAVSRNNHFLDAGVYACVGAHGVGERLISEAAVVVEKTTPPANTSNGSPLNYRGKW